MSGTRTLHFDVFDRVSSGDARAAEEPLTLRIAGEAYPLSAHTAATRAAARGSNAALALIPQPSLERITHFAEVPAAALPGDRVAHLQVTAPNPDPEQYLPSLVNVCFKAPAAYRLGNMRRKLAARGDGAAAEVPFELRQYGVEAVPRAAAELDWWEDVDDLVPSEVARTLIFHHPQLGSVDPYAAAIVLEDHIGALRHEQVMRDLGLAILAQGRGGWYRHEVARDVHGDALRFAFDIEDGDEGKPVEIYALSDRIDDAMTVALAAILETVQADERLRSRSWRSEPGITAVRQPELQPGRRALRDSGLSWTLADLTPNNGIGAERGSIEMGPDRRFSIEVRNHHMRVLGAFARFYDDGGRLLSGYPWDSNLDPSLDYDDGATKFLELIPSRGSVMGIPITVVRSTLELPFPDDASSVRLLFGGLGQASSWETNVCLGGAMVTGIFNYAIPTIFMVSTAGVEETYWTTDLLQDVGVQTGAMLAGVAVIGDDATPDVTTFLAIFASAAGGIIVSKGLEKVALKLRRKLLRSQLRGAIPFIGWAFKVAALAAGGAAMGVTSVQCASSPATLKIDVKRTMDLELTLRPDPAHGEAGRPETAVWPGVSDNYKITVEYRGGTAFEQVGPMWEETTNEPLVVRFSDIPAGGWLRVIAGIYAENGWLCGQWASAEVRALPPQGGGPLPVGGEIEEVLVPLSRDTRYLYRERIVWDAALREHVWRTGDKPSGTFADVSCADDGKSLCEIASLSLNGSGFQIGYSFQASGQRLPLCGLGSAPAPQQTHTFQNLSVLARPESRMLFPSCAFTARTLVAYDQFLDESAPPQLSQRNFFLDRRDPDGPPHLRQLLLSGDRPELDLGVPLPSWGTIPLRLPSAMAVHPNGYVIAASWADDLLAIAELPEAPVPDRDAKPAALVAGRGARAGLVNGPQALTVTADGRILVLETGNRRLQAFDTHANVVPSFDGEHRATLPTAHAATLDAAELSLALHDAFHDSGLTTHRFDLPAAFRGALDSRQLTDALREQLALEGLRISRDPDNPADPATNGAIEVLRAGSEWWIVDALQEHAYRVRTSGSGLALRDELEQVTIEVRKAGEDWVLTDHGSGAAFHLRRADGRAAQIELLEYLPYMPLHAEPGERLTPLDLAAEAKGYIYVLAHRADGRSVDDFVLDVYEPNGSFLTRTTGLNAARIAVDLWRDLYALSHGAIAGPGGRIEPAVAKWTPTPPAPQGTRGTS